ncbi:aminodeoxychorismate/anthranilate synthase component II [bacterium]|nr:aminodeoxychorismate/anthranilate synthase component II [bacterium]
MILVIDNYDSFVHNLARYFRQLGLETKVVRNDKITIDEIQLLSPSAIVISPGPCTPNEAGCSLEVVRKLGHLIPTLGVCLGHQVIIQVFGGDVVPAPAPIHGRSTSISHVQKAVFENVPSPFTVGRYHSLIGDSASIPSCLSVTAETSEGIVMAVSHREHPIVGLQFHPESILTEHGYLLLRNFAQLAGLPTRQVAGEKR